MVQTAIRMKTRVLPGKRIEVVAPELAEGDNVELILLKEQDTNADQQPGPRKQGVWDWIQSLPPSNRTPAEWAEIEREFREERDSWDR